MLLFLMILVVMKKNTNKYVMPGDGLQFNYLSYLQED